MSDLVCNKTGKRCFTKKEANGAINSTYKNGRGGKRRRRLHRPDHLRAYPCPHCNYHHLTSRPK